MQDDAPEAICRSSAWLEGGFSQVRVWVTGLPEWQLRIPQRVREKVTDMHLSDVRIRKEPADQAWGRTFPRGFEPLEDRYRQVEPRQTASFAPSACASYGPGLGFDISSFG